jgi:hypothetical protein
MCHHRELEYERLYESADERDTLPDWANEPDEENAAETDDESESLAPNVADD